MERLRRFDRLLDGGIVIDDREDGFRPWAEALNASDHVAAVESCLFDDAQGFSERRAALLCLRETNMG